MANVIVDIVFTFVTVTSVPVDIAVKGEGAVEAFLRAKGEWPRVPDMDLVNEELIVTTRIVEGGHDGDGV